jgi:hypothetical protein
MLPFGVTIPYSIPQRLEIPEGRMNYPVFVWSMTAVFINTRKEIQKLTYTAVILIRTCAVIFMADQDTGYMFRIVGCQVHTKRSSVDILYVMHSNALRAIY